MNEYMQYLAELIPEKDSLKLVKSEAEKNYKSHFPDDCFSMGMSLYQSDNFQIQEVVLILRIIPKQRYSYYLLIEKIAANMCENR